MNWLKVLFKPQLPRAEEKRFRITFTVLALVVLVLAFINIFILKNQEFAFYFFLAFGVLFLFFEGRRRSQLDWKILVAAGLLMVLLLLDNTVRFSGFRLYDSYLLGLRFDNIAHFLGFVFVAFVVYRFLIHYFKPIIKKHYLLATVIFLTLGLGAMLEIFEFSAVAFFQANVGDYTNNALDWVVDGFGALVGAVAADVLHWKKLRA